MEGKEGTARVEAFADGVFSIVITLLIVEIRVPTNRRWPPAADCSTADPLTADPHKIFRYISRSNHPFAMLNPALLLCVGFLPSPTALRAASLSSPSERIAATSIYSAALTMTAAVFNPLWRYAAFEGRGGTMPTRSGFAL